MRERERRRERYRGGSVGQNKRNCATFCLSLFSGETCDNARLPLCGEPSATAAHPTSLGGLLMAVSSTSRGRRPTLADLLAAAKQREATGSPGVGLVEPAALGAPVPAAPAPQAPAVVPVRAEALAASGQVRLDPATGSPIVTLDDLDVVDSESGDCGEHGEWLVALVEHPHTPCPHAHDPSHAGRRRHLWWEHRQTGELRCCGCWSKRPPLRSLVRRLWADQLTSDGQWLFGAKVGYSEWPWDDAITRQAEQDRREFAG